MSSQARPHPRSVPEVSGSAECGFLQPLERLDTEPAPMGVGLTLSGGGFRAALFHVGVIRQLRKTGHLHRVTHICAVSGGSIVAAHLLTHWAQYTGTQAQFEAAEAQILALTQRDVRGEIIRRIPFLALQHFLPAWLPGGHARTRSALLERALADALFGNRRMYTLPDVPRLHLLATNMTQGGLCSFTQEGFSIDIGPDPAVPPRLLPSRTVSVALAVATSAAHPALFPPVQINAELLGVRPDAFVPNVQAFNDGGIFDNLGVRKLLQLDDALVATHGAGFERMFVSDAGASFDNRWQNAQGVAGLYDASVRTGSILAHRIRDLECERLDLQRPGWRDADNPRMVRIEIGEVLDESNHVLAQPVQMHVESIRTDLDRFTEMEREVLLQHGEHVARAAMGEARAPAAEVPVKMPPPHKQVRQIQRSSRRSWQLFSIRDPISLLYLGLLGLFLVFGLPAIGGWVTRGVDALESAVMPDNTVVVAGRKYLEASIMVELFATMIEETDTEGLTVQRQFHLAPTQTNFTSLIAEHEEVDVYTDYTGSLMIFELNQPRARQIDRLSHTPAWLNLQLAKREEPGDIEVLQTLGFENGWAMTMLRSRAQELDLISEDGRATLSALARVSQSEKITYMSTSKHASERGVYEALARGYGVQYAPVGVLRHEQKYDWLRLGRMDLTDGYETDPDLVFNPDEFVVLEDDRSQLAHYFAVPVARQSTLARHPQLRAGLEQLEGQVTESDMAGLLQAAREASIESSVLPYDKEARARLKRLVRGFLLDKGVLD